MADPIHLQLLADFFNRIGLQEPMLRRKQMSAFRSATWLPNICQTASCSG
jgi:hypothetical protein